MSYKLHKGLELFMVSSAARTKPIPLEGVTRKGARGALQGGGWSRVRGDGPIDSFRTWACCVEEKLSDATHQSRETGGRHVFYFPRPLTDQVKYWVFLE